MQNFDTVLSRYVDMTFLTRDVTLIIYRTNRTRLRFMCSFSTVRSSVKVYSAVSLSTKLLWNAVVDILLCNRTFSQSCRTCNWVHILKLYRLTCNGPLLLKLSVFENDTYGNPRLMLDIFLWFSTLLSISDTQQSVYKVVSAFKQFTNAIYYTLRQLILHFVCTLYRQTTLSINLK